MPTIVGIRFRKACKIYYFDPVATGVAKGDYAIVETARGLEYGQVVLGPREVEGTAQPLKPVIRKASTEDEEKVAQNSIREEEAFHICERRIQAHGLLMNLVDVEFTFDVNKIIFYFTADGRIDFRELVKDLAGIFRTRIELHQIGVRDEAKMLGGIGCCGRPLCCATFLGDFEPVSIKMAKNQNLSLNPTKISGICGRLMCCLKYEDYLYSKNTKRQPRSKEEPPKMGSKVSCSLGEGRIVRVDRQDRQASVQLTPDNVVTVSWDEIVVPDDKSEGSHSEGGAKDHTDHAETGKKEASAAGAKKNDSSEGSTRHKNNEHRRSHSSERSEHGERRHGHNTDEQEGRRHGHNSDEQEERSHNHGHGDHESEASNTDSKNKHRHERRNRHNKHQESGENTAKENLVPKTDLNQKNMPLPAPAALPKAAPKAAPVSAAGASKAAAPAVTLSQAVAPVSATVTAQAAAPAAGTPAVTAPAVTAAVPSWSVPAGHKPAPDNKGRGRQDHRHNPMERNHNNRRNHPNYGGYRNSWGSEDRQAREAENMKVKKQAGPSVMRPTGSVSEPAAKNAGETVAAKVSPQSPSSL